MPGPPPKPTALKVLQGNPGGKPLNTQEPQPTRGAPRPPASLRGEALAEWGRIVPELDSLGLLAKVDRAYLVAYCESWAAFDASREILAEQGPLVTGRDGGLVKNPAAQIMKDSADLMLKFGARFGLSPADRVRLVVPMAGPEEGRGEAAALSLLS